MKKITFFIVLCISIGISSMYVSAVSSSIHSQWAEESLIRADEAGILPSFFEDGDLTSNITRADF